VAAEGQVAQDAPPATITTTATATATDYQIMPSPTAHFASPASYTGSPTSASNSDSGPILILPHSAPHVKLEDDQLRFFLGERASISRGNRSVSFTLDNKKEKVGPDQVVHLSDHSFSAKYPTVAEVIRATKHKPQTYTRVHAVLTQSSTKIVSVILKYNTSPSTVTPSPSQTPSALLFVRLLLLTPIYSLSLSCGGAVAASAGPRSPDGQEKADDFPALENQAFYDSREVSDDDTPNSRA
jgi:hypothetical protein